MAGVLRCSLRRGFFPTRTKEEQANAYSATSMRTHQGQCVQSKTNTYKDLVCVHTIELITLRTLGSRQRSQLARYLRLEAIPPLCFSALP
jgi:hypothetical protein